MRDELESLKTLIEPKALRVRDIKDTRLILKEPKNEGTTKLSQVTLFGIPEETVVFTLDQQSCKMSSYLSQVKGGWNKGCDYVIATHDGKTGWLLICEMKSGSPQGFVPQLKSGDAYASYLDGLINHFCKGRLASYQRRHVLFHQPTLMRKREFGAAAFTIEEKEKLKLIKVDRPVLRIEELFIPT